MPQHTKASKKKSLADELRRLNESIAEFADFEIMSEDDILDRVATVTDLRTFDTEAAQSVELEAYIDFAQFVADSCQVNNPGLSTLANILLRTREND